MKSDDELETGEPPECRRTGLSLSSVPNPSPPCLDKAVRAQREGGHNSTKKKKTPPALLLTAPYLCKGNVLRVANKAAAWFVGFPRIPTTIPNDRCYNTGTPQSAVLRLQTGELRSFALEDGSALPGGCLVVAGGSPQLKGSAWGGH